MVEKKNKVSQVADGTMENKNNKISDAQRTMLKSAAGVVGSGILLGSLTTFIDHGNATAENGDLLAQAASDPDLDAHNFGWSDGDVEISDLNTDHMSFGEAFGAARADVGAGGAFVWKGQVFTTYTAEEWNNLPLEQQSDFENHFDMGTDQHATPVVVEGNEMRNALNDELVADLQEQVDAFSSDLADDMSEATAQMESETPDLFENNPADLNVATAAVDDDVLMAAVDDVEAEVNQVDDLLQDAEELNTDDLMASVDVQEVQETAAAAGGVSLDDIQLDSAMDAVSQTADDELVASVDHIQDAVDDVQNVIDDAGAVHYNDIEFASVMDENSVSSDDELVASVDHLDEVVDDVQVSDNGDMFADNAEATVEQDGDLLASVDDIQQAVDEVTATLEDSQLAGNPILGEAGNDLAATVNEEEIQNLLDDIRGEIDAEDLVNYEYNPEDYVNNGDVDSYDAV